MSQSLDNAHANSRLHVFLSSAKVRLLLLATGIVSLSSCIGDPVRTIRHNVTMAVVDEHNVPAPDVKVTMKESWESFQLPPGAVPESDKPYLHQRWGMIPWLRGITDSRGKGVIEIEKTALDWTKGSTPPPERDVVSNREYIIKLQGQNVEDELRLVMKPGASVKGKFFAVTVIDIQKPRYVPTRKRNENK